MFVLFVFHAFIFDALSVGFILFISPTQYRLMTPDINEMAFYETFKDMR